MIIVTVTNKTSLLEDNSFLYIIFKIQYEPGDIILPIINDILSKVSNTIYINNSIYVPEFYTEEVVNILKTHSCCITKD
jgi:hypothetical protein